MEDILDRVWISERAALLWGEAALSLATTGIPPYDIGDERAVALPGGDLLVYVNRVSTGRTLVSMRIGSDGWALKEG